MIITPLVLVPLNQFYIEIKSYKTLTVKLNRYKNPPSIVYCEHRLELQVDDLRFKITSIRLQTSKVCQFQWISHH